MVSNWEPAHSLLEDAICGAKIAPPPPSLSALAVACLPLCLWPANLLLKKSADSLIGGSLTFDSLLSLAVFPII